MLTALGQVKSLSVTRADLWTLVGVLELERGAPQAPAGRFEAALAAYATAAAHTPNVSRPGEPLAARYYEALRQHNRSQS